MCYKLIEGLSNKFIRERKMKLVYSGEPFPDEITKSMFLAGPTPRNDSAQSWRIPDALEILERLNYDGHAFIPEHRPGAGTCGDFDTHTYREWETAGLHRADKIVFWVPRELKTMPAFTTNVEWGAWRRSGKAVFGAPSGAPKTLYLKLEAEEFGVPQFTSLEETLAHAVTSLGNGARRTGGECFVPLHIWNTESFQQWYKNLVRTGNRLVEARVEWVVTSKKKNVSIPAWALRTKIFIAAENRTKEDVVISRRDISAVMLWKKRPNLLDSEIVLVKEFRNPARTADGFVHELPGGSTPKDGVNPLSVAVEEVLEETGVYFEPSRFTLLGSRQLAGTFSSHHAHLFSIHLTDCEYELYKSRVGHVCGNYEEGTERTVIEMKTLREIVNEKCADYATLGMILDVISE